MKLAFITLLISTMLSGNTIYDFKVEGLDGKTIDLAQYKGKKIMIVNTASNCGNTPQYEELEKLHKQYRDKLVIIGFPANNFGAQEPGSNEEIAEFCKKNFGVSFPMAAKVSVKGDDIDPLFKYLVSESRELAKQVKIETSKDGAWSNFLRDPITWNFTKFLIDENGKLVTVFHNKVAPMSQEVLQWLN